MKRFAFFFAVSLCVALAAASVYAADYADISVRVETVTASLGGRGYEEHRAIIINRSITRSHRVTLEMVSGAYGDGEVRRTAEVAPSSVITFSIMKLATSYANEEARVFIDGSRQDAPVEIDRSRTSAWVNRSPSMFYMIVSPDIDKSGFMNDTAVDTGFKNAAGENDVAYLAYKSPMPEWSSNWAAYSSFDGVIITAEELRAAPDGVRSALWKFAECGGSLLIIGAWEIPEQWRSRLGISVEEESEETEAAVATASRKVSLNPSNATATYFVGFGNVTIVDAASLKRILPAQWGEIKYRWTGSRPVEKNYRDLVEINRDFPVIDKLGIPVRGLFVLILIFVVVIGPVNMIWLARRRRKIWMLWTVPAIAIVTCLAITGFAFLAEGLSSMSRAETFTILDESSHRASTIGWTAFYAPITPSDGLRFSYDTELAPIRPDMWAYTRGVNNRTIDLSNDQHLDSGWVTARVPAYFRLRKSETRRERLTIRRAKDGSISVVNGLGSDIRELWVADRDNVVYTASGIRAGAEAKLSLAPGKSVGNQAVLRGLFTSGDWLAKIRGVTAAPLNILAPGCYLARLDANPFVEEGMKNVKTREGSALVYGLSAAISESER